MSRSYTSILIQYVWSTHRRAPYIKESFREELQHYICGTIKELDELPVACYCMPDHCHLLVFIRAKQSISEIICKVKAASSKWLKGKKYVPPHFRWNEGYGGFSYSRWDINKMINYINNQKEHHGLKNFETEYLELLIEHRIPFELEKSLDLDVTEEEKRNLLS